MPWTMVKKPGDLPWMLTLISPDGDHEFEFYETEDEANQASVTMIESGIEDNSSIYISRIISQGVEK